MKRIYPVLLFLCFSFGIFAQDSTSMSGRLLAFAKKAARFNQEYSQEKAYLHFDNTGYFLGETIWFKAYVVRATTHTMTDMSKTLYVDLLSPEGYLIDNKKLKITNGVCYGEFALPDSLKAGYYEIRAYTRCMLNFGPEVVFSRVFPVFDTPKVDGDYSDRNMTYRKFTIPDLREKAAKRDKVNLVFFPEGGNLIAGLESKVAFKATDKQGKNIDVTGQVFDSKGEVKAPIQTQHDGMGAFNLLPDEGKYTAKVQYDNREYKFELPVAERDGYVLTAYNLSSQNLRLMIRKSPNVPPTDTVALVVTCRGQILDFRTLSIAEDGSMFTYKKSSLPAGVCQFTLYDTEGRIRCERLVFNKKESKSTLTVKTNKNNYKPYEKVSVNLKVQNQRQDSIYGLLSLAIRDGASSDFGNSDNGNLATNLLLSSDLKGYIENPAWYFADSTRDQLLGLDLLMMTQGWRRYSWKRMEGLEEFNAKQPIEEGILMDGKVLSLLAKKEKKNIDVTFWMINGVESYRGNCVTDANGNFNFMLDMYGWWDLNIQTKDEDKRKEFRILLNRTFTPEPRSYTGYDKEVWINNRFKSAEPIPDSTALLLGEIKYATETTPTNPEGYKEYTLKEVVKTAKRPLTQMQQAVRMASLGYDVQQVTDAHRDKGISEAPDILQMLGEENKYFSIFDDGEKKIYRYKGHPVHFMFNTTQSEYTGTRIVEDLQIDEVEKVLIIEDQPTVRYYYPEDDKDPVIIMFVFYPNGIRRKEPIGVRKTVFQGYSLAREFYHPVYQPGVPILDADHRRTLYWNPDILTDAHGNAKAEFFNNGTCKSMIISAEGIATDGSVLVNEQK